MKRGRVSVEKIISILKGAEAGVPVAKLCRKHGMTDATFYNWRKSTMDLTPAMQFVSRGVQRDKKRPDRNVELRAALFELAMKKPKYGFQLLFALLKRKGRRSTTNVWRGSIGS